MQTKSIHRATRLVAAALLAGVSTQALAQTSPNPAQTQDANGSQPPLAAQQTPGAPPTNTEPQASTQGDVVVTGSRITRKDYQAESPIVTVGQAAIQNSGTADVSQTLVQLPQFAASAGGQSQASTTGQSRAAGRATANLRGLGAPRTLVLLDGRRLQPSDAFNVPDINSIAPILIQNVEVITGGASATYGSDAIAGVVNFRLRDKFKGLEVDLQPGVTDKGDGFEFTGSALVGGTFADDRGSAMAAFSYFKRDEIQQSTRKFFNDVNGLSVGLRGSAVASGANPYSAAALRSIYVTKYGLAAAPAASQAEWVNANGSLYAPVGAIHYLGLPDYIVNAAAGNTVQAYRDQTLVAPLTRYTGFARVTYDVTDAITAYSQFMLTQYNTQQDSLGLNGKDGAVVVPVTNPFIPADLRTLLASRPNPNAAFNYEFNGGRVSPIIYQQDNTIYQFVGGLKGRVGISDWTWDAYASYGRTTSDQRSIGYIDRQAFLNLINAPDGGNAICAGGYDLFNNTALSSACQRYLDRDTLTQERFEQTAAEATMQGRLFKLPGGDARFAAGLSYRNNSFTSRPDSQFTNNTVIAAVVSLPSAGSQSVKEVFGEVLLPVLRDLPFIHSLEFNLGGRYSDYDTSGGYATYKATGEWGVTDSLLIRGGYQRSIRAPSIGELFSSLRGSSTVVGTPSQGGGDPCDIRSTLRLANPTQVRALCVATGVPTSVVDSLVTSGTSVRSAQGGNTALTAEKADSYTIGAAIRPHFGPEMLRRFSVSVDYYNITIQQAIGVITAGTSLLNCFNNASSNPTYSATNFYCGNITRQASGQVDTVFEPVANLARYATSGIDTQIDWSLRGDDVGAPGLGTIDVNGVVSWVDTYKLQNVAGGPFLDYAGTIGNNSVDVESLSHPRWKGAGSLTWSKGGSSVGGRLRYIGAMRDASRVGSTTSVAPGVNAIVYFDFNVRQRVNDKFELRAGIVNAFDRDPPVWTGQATVDRTLYDLEGRRFFVGVTTKF